MGTEGYMRFSSRSPNFTKVCEPKRQVYLPNGEKGDVTTGLQARFVNHHFDSLEAQRRNGWTDEQRNTVEQKLLSMYGFGTAGSGVYLDEHQPEEGGEQEAVVPAAAEASVAPSADRCIYTVPTAEGTEQCSRQARANGDFCNEHYRLMATTGTGGDK